MEYVMALIIEERKGRMHQAMHSFHLVAELRQLFEGWCCVHKGLLAQLEGRGLHPLQSTQKRYRKRVPAHLALVEGQGLDLPLLLQTVNNVLVAPADLVGQTLQRDIV